VQAGRKSNIKKPIIDPVRDPMEKVSNGVDETGLLNYPVLLSFPRRACPERSRMGGNPDYRFLERYYYAQKNT